MKTRLRVVLLPALLVTAMSGQAASSHEYAWSFPLETRSDSAAYRIELTPGVYAHTLPSAGLRDMVVVNAKGHEVPFGPMPGPEPEVRPYQAKVPLLLSPQPEAATPSTGTGQEGESGNADTSETSRAWLIDTHRPIALESIKLILPPELGEIRWRVSVQSSNDLQHWQPRDAGTTILRVASNETSVIQRVIQLDDQATARYYRVRMIQDWNIGREAGDLRAILTGSVTVASHNEQAQWHWITIQPQKSEGGTDFYYRLPAALPVGAVRIKPAGTNMATRFTLSSGTGYVLGSMTVVNTAGHSDSTNTLRFAPRRLTRLQLHSNNALANPPTLTIGWQPATFVFLANGPGPYRLLAGSYAARRGDYPMEKALDQLHSGTKRQPPYAALGEVHKAAGPAALRPAQSSGGWSQFLLWLLLIAAAMLVAGMALSLIRRHSDE